jgi:hypothetical protein
MSVVPATAPDPYSIRYSNLNMAALVLHILDFWCLLLYGIEEGRHFLRGSLFLLSSGYDPVDALA